MKNWNIKNLTLSAAIFLLIAAHTQAQILDPTKVLKRKATDRTNQKIDQSIDKALDKVFDGFGKKKTSEEREEEEPSYESNDTEASDASESMGKLFGNLGFGGAPAPASSYSFSSSYVMQLKNSGRKKDENYTMKIKYMFDEEGKIMGSKILSSDNPDLNKSLEMMEAMVFDVDKMYMYSFMNVNGQKQFMGVSVKEGAVGDALEGQYQKTKLTKLGETRTIAGYKSEAFLVDDGQQQSTVWLSVNAIPSVARYYDAFNKMTASQKNQMKVAFQANPELLQLFQQGRALMAMETSTKDAKTELEILEISPRDSFSIQTAGYRSMMDINSLMNGANADKN